MKAEEILKQTIPQTLKILQKQLSESEWDIVNKGLIGIMIKYARLKCKEQKRICYEANGVKTYHTKMTILEAREPEFN